MLRERRREQRTPRGERERIRQQAFVTRQPLGLARMLAPEPLEKEARAVPVGQVVDQRFDLFRKL